MAVKRDSPLSSERRQEDRALDRRLRPERFEDFVGQRAVVRNLQLYVEAARQREEPLDHLLLSGMPGLGKTTLALIVASAMGTQLHPTSGPALDRPADLVGTLSQMQRADILFVDELHRLPTCVEEYLYSAMEDFTINISLDKGPHGRTMQLPLQPFTLVGATTREGLLTGPFRSRFGVLEKLGLYPPEDLTSIVERSARILGVDLDEEASLMIASRARGTPRIANRILRRVRDLAQVKADNRISMPVAREGLAMLGIDDSGLEELDRKILQTLLENKGEPVGLKTIAVRVGEAENTLEEVYEPYLLQQGYMQKTPRGRKLTERGCRVARGSAPDSDAGQPTLF